MSNQQEQYYQGPRLTFNDEALAEENEEMIYFDDENYCYEYNDSLYQEETDMMYYEEEMYREEYEQPYEQPETCSTKQEGQDALLNLVVGVQQYLADLQMTGFDNRQESPLLDLQYKMYTYLKQRAYEMGADLDEALEQAM
ncbi:hypothetical protein INT43_002642 [Umbelopsis isabellina]|uniref:Uncharacterized protein n=1 Tax=Mortierella isabellina TaxID=91625 RepID=A0A8H7UPF1_MORIS|nr:hypothetical protein INT43_002642 [Umbelopsis isabellina]